MKRKRLIRILSIALLLTLSLGIFAPYSFAQDPVKKFCRGLLNVSFGFLEVFKNVRDTGKEDGVGMAISYGALKGVYYMVKRMAVGVYEIVTFPIPIPEDYAPVLDDPEYFLGKDEESIEIDKD